MRIWPSRYQFVIEGATVGYQIAGHVVMYDRPVGLNTALRSFLAAQRACPVSKP